MQSTNIPSKIPLPFGYAAGSGYINPIPAASQIGIQNGRASLYDGFPPDTFTPIAAGGVPPFGADFNGILNEITSIQQWQEAGGFFPFDPTFASTIGGYPKNAVIQSSTGAGFWLCTTENNTANPDSGGAGWIPYKFYGDISVALSGASVTLSNLEAAYPIISLTGALTQNTIVIIPDYVQQWTMVNNTSGGFSVQLKTSAGSGVYLNQGQATQVYGDGTNIYLCNSFSQSLNQNGYQILPSGLVIQWGSATSAGGSGSTVAFPYPFPNTCFQIIVSDSGSTALSWGAGAINSLTFECWSRNPAAAGAYQTGSCRWYAVGY